MPQDPLTRGPKPPQPSQQQEPPGLEAEMDPRPDYGEKTYKGSGKLAGKAAVITGGDRRPRRAEPAPADIPRPRPRRPAAQSRRTPLTAFVL